MCVYVRVDHMSTESRPLSVFIINRKISIDTLPLGSGNCDVIASDGFFLAPPTSDRHLDLTNLD